MEKDKIKQISKSLSYWLRHRPDDIGIKVDKEGWVDISELMDKSKDKIQFTFEDLKEVVEQNDKKRFVLDEKNMKIRAAQGHSINVEIKFKEFIPKDFVYHGTAKRNVDAILKKGLIPQTRTHVHMSKDVETATSVGLRHSKNKNDLVILKIDAMQMYRDGETLFISENDVILSKHVNKKYISI